jgi:hypothetical protein
VDLSVSASAVVVTASAEALIGATPLRAYCLLIPT